MSAFTNTFTLSHLTRSKPLVTGKKKRTDGAATHRSGTRTRRRSSPPRAENGVSDFSALYHTYQRRVYSQCFGMLRNHLDAEDAAQEVFLQLFRKVHTFRGESSFSTWLYRLTINCVLMEIRRKRYRKVESTAGETPLGMGEGNAIVDPPLDTYQAPPAAVLDRVSLGVALSELPKGYQRIFELHDVEGYTHEEIASFLGIRVGTSKSQLHKARLRMRLLLQTGPGGSENAAKLPQNPMLSMGRAMSMEGSSA